MQVGVQPTFSPCGAVCRPLSPVVRTATAVINEMVQTRHQCLHRGRRTVVGHFGQERQLRNLRLEIRTFDLEILVRAGAGRNCQITMVLHCAMVDQIIRRIIGCAHETHVYYWPASLGL